MTRRYHVVFAVVAMLTLPAVANAGWRNPLARWGTGPLAGFRATRKLMRQQKTQPALRLAYNQAAKPKNPGATFFNRVLGSAGIATVTGSGYLTYLALLGTASPLVLMAATAATTSATAVTLRCFVRESRTARRGKRAGLEAAYLAAKADPALFKLLDAATKKYFEYHLAEKSKDYGRSIQRLQASKAALDTALSPTQLVLPTP